METLLLRWVKQASASSQFLSPFLFDQWQIFQMVFTHFLSILLQELSGAAEWLKLN